MLVKDMVTFIKPNSERFKGMSGYRGYQRGYFFIKYKYIIYIYL